MTFTNWLAALFAVAIVFGVAIVYCLVQITDDMRRTRLLMEQLMDYARNSPRPR